MSQQPEAVTCETVDGPLLDDIEKDINDRVKSTEIRAI